MPVGEQPVHSLGGGLHFVQLQEGRAVLCDENAAIVQAAATGLVELFREQCRSRTDRVGRIDDDHVELLFDAQDETQAVVDQQVQARILERTSGVLGQELPAHLHQ